VRHKLHASLENSMRGALYTVQKGASLHLGDWTTAVSFRPKHEKNAAGWCVRIRNASVQNVKEH
jgi:hypothetical protein